METNDNNQNDAPDVRAKGKRGRPCLPKGANVHGRGADERAAHLGGSKAPCGVDSEEGQA